MTRVNYKCLCWIVFCVSALLGFQRAVAAPPPAEQNINYMRTVHGASYLGHDNSASEVPLQVLGSGGLNNGRVMFDSTFVPAGGSYSAEGMIFTSDDSQAFNEPSASNVTTWGRNETSGYAVIDLHSERSINKINFYQVNTVADGRVSGAQVRVWLDNSVPPSSAVLPGSAGWTDPAKAKIILPFSDVGTIPYISQTSVSNIVFRSDVRYLLYEFTQTGDNFLEVPKVWMGYDSSIPGPEVIISKTNSVTDENGGTDTFTVVLSGFQPTSPVEITLVSSDTDEATVAPSTLTFTSADWNVPQVVTITGVDDAIIGVDHSATITVAVNPAASDDAYDSLSSQTVSVLLNNDDIDTTRPTVAISHSSVPASAGRPLRIEENTATVTFTFSEDVSDFDLTDVGVTSGALTNLSGSGSSYTALFTAPAGVETDSVISIADNTFSDATGNFNADGNDADNQVAISVDTLRPTLAMSADKSVLTAGETATITFAFSEAVQQFDVGDVIVTGGTLGSFTGSGSSYTAVFTPDGSSTSGVMSVDSGRFADLAFNANNDGSDADNQVTLPIDATPPTVAVSSSASAVKAGETATITFTFSEDVSDFDLSDVNVTSGGLANLTGSGSSYTAVFTPAVDVEVDSVLSIADNTFSDVAGNANADGSDADNQVAISVDTLRPTLAMSSSASEVKAGETATITFTFSEDVSDFDLGDVNVTNGALATLTGSGSDYTAVFTPAADFEGDSIISVAANTFSDAAGNFNIDAADESIGVDTTLPTLSNITTTVAAGTATVSGSCTMDGDTVSVSIADGVPDPAQVMCAAGGFSVDVGVDAIPDGTVSVSIAIEDPSGNTNTATSQAAIDNTPTISQDGLENVTDINESGYQVTGSCEDPGDAITVEVGDGNNPVVAGSGSCGSGGTYSVTLDVSSLGEGTLIVTSTINDGVNPAVSDTDTTTKDNLPTVTDVTTMVADGTATVSGSCTMDGDTVSVSIAGGVPDPAQVMCAAGGFSVDVGVDAIPDGTVSVSIAIEDAAGNTATTSSEVAIDNTPTISQDGLENVTDINESGYQVTGSCEDPGDAITVEVGDGSNPVVTGSGSCGSGGTYSVTLDVSSLGEGTLIVTSTINDGVNPAVSDTDTTTKDNIPSITQTVVPADRDNENAYPVMGSCQYPGDAITVEVGDGNNPVVAGSGSCGSGSTYSVTLDVSSLDEGSITVTSTINDGVNPAVSDTDTTTKDNLPTVTDVTTMVADGTATVSGSCTMDGDTVSVSIAGGVPDPAQVMCAAGGFSVDVGVDAIPDGTVSVSIAIEDPSGNTNTATSQAAIDNTPTISQDGLENVTDINESGYQVKGSCEDPGDAITVEVGDGSNPVVAGSGSCGSGGTYSVTLDVSSLGEGTLIVTSTINDGVNPAVSDTDTTTKDNIPSITQTVVPADRNNENAYPVMGSCQYPGDAITVEVGDGNNPVVAGSGSCGSGSTYSVTLDVSSLDEGSITVTSTINDGVYPAVSDTDTTTKDNLPTVTDVTTMVADGTATVSGSCTMDGDTVSVSIAGGVPDPAQVMCAAGGFSVDVGVDAIPDGTVSVSIAIEDPSGNTNTATSQAAIDNTPTISQDGLENVTDINESGYQVTGSCEDPGDAITVEVGDGNNPVVAGSGSCGSGGTYSVTLDVSSLGEGTLIVTSTINDGVNPAVSDTDTTTKDNLPTVTDVTTMVADGTATVSGSCTMDGDTVSVSIAGGVPDPAQVMCAAGGFSVDVGVDAIPDGTVSVSIAIEDAAGNTATTSSEVAIDNTPTISQDGLENVTDINESGYQVTGSCEDPGDAITVEVGDGNNPVVTGSGSCGSGGTYSVTLDVSSLGEGTLIVTSTINDGVNPAVSDTDTTTKDNIPSITQTVVPADRDNENAYPVMGSCQYPGDAITVEVGDGNNPVVAGSGSCGSGSTYSVTLDVSSLDEGSITVTSTINDGVNPAVSDTDTTTKDNLPTVTDVTTMVADGTATVSGSCTMDGDTVSVSIAGGVPDPAQVMCAAGGFSVDVGVDAIPDGTVSVSIAIEDPSGNTNTATSQAAIDNTPTISQDGLENVTDINESGYQVKGSCEDPGDAITVEVGDGSNPVVAGSGSCGSGGTYSVTLDVSSLGEGTLIVTSTINDGVNPAVSDTDTTTKDNIPSITQTVVPADRNNENAYPVMGSCQYPGDAITVEVGDGNNPVVAGSGSCGSGSTYSVTLDVSSLDEGSITVTSTINDGVYPAVSDTDTTTKDNLPTVTDVTTMVADGTATVSGSCTMDGDTVSVSIAGGVPDPAQVMCAAGGFSVDVGVDAIPDGTVSVSIAIEDPSGNTNTATSQAAIDNTPTISQDGLENVTDINESGYQVKGSCEDPGDAITVEIGDGSNPVVAGSGSCGPGGTYSVTLSVSSLDEGTLIVTSTINDGVNPAVSDTDTTTKDNIPSITQTVVPADRNNENAYPVMGSCQYPGDAITVEVGDGNNPAVAGSGSCGSGGTYSVTLDVSSLGEGSLVVTSTINDGVNPAVSDTDTTTKDNLPTVTDVTTMVADGTATVSGSCTMDGDTVSVSIAGGVPDPAQVMCAAGGFSVDVGVDAIPDGTVSVSIAIEDPSGNTNTATSQAAIDNTPTISQDGLENVTDINESGYQVKGSCEDPGDAITVEVGDGSNPVVAGSGSCGSGGTYSVTLDVSSLGEGTLIVTSTINDGVNPAVSDTDTTTKDNIPSITQTVVPADRDNENAYPVMGSCQYPGDAITVEVGDGSNPVVAGSGSCGSGGTYSVTLDVSSLGEGTLIVTSTINDSVNPAVSDTDTTTKDNLPTVTDVTTMVADGTATVSGSCTMDGDTVSVSIAGGVPDPAQVMCAAGGFSVDVGVDAIPDGTVSVSIAIEDPSGNTNTATSQAAIDNTPTISQDGLENVTDINESGYQVTGSCEDPGDAITVEVGDGNNPVVAGSGSCGSGGTYSVTLDVSSLGEGTLIVTSTINDGVNPAVSDTDTTTKDNIPSITQTVVPADRDNENAYPVMGSCQYPGDAITVEVGDGSNPVVAGSGSCGSGGTYSVTLDVSSLGEGTLIVTSTINDGVNPAVSDTDTTTKDNLPTVTDVTTMVADGTATVSGSCTMDGDTVSVSIAGGVPDPAQVMCAAGGFSVDVGVDAIPDGTVSVSIAIEDPSGNTDTATSQAAIDNAPTINQDGLVNVTDINEGGYLVTGSCEDPGDAITVEVGDGNNPVVAGSGSCGSGGTYSVTLDVSSLGEGTLIVTSTINDGVNPAVSDTDTTTKDNLPTVTDVTTMVADGTATVTGSCSEAGDTVSVSIAGGVPDPAQVMCAAGGFSVDVGVDAIPDGTVSVSIAIEDPSGNTDTATSQAAIDNAPTINQDGLVNVTDINESGYLVTGSCEDPGDAITVEVGDGSNPVVTGSGSCGSGGTYSVTLDVSSLGEGSLVVTSTINDGVNPAVSDTDTTTKDNLPSITQTVVPVTDVNESNYLVTGSCQYPGDAITVEVGDGNNPVVAGSGSCGSGGTYSVTLDVSSLDEGSITVTSTINDSVNLPVSDVDNTSKDLQPVARDDTGTVTAGESTTIAILANDVIPGVATVTVSSLDGQGATTVNSDGSLNYMAAPIDVGTVTIVYQLCDADNDCSTASVVLSVNTPTIDAQEDMYQIFDINLSTDSVLLNDTFKGQVATTDNVGITTYTVSTGDPDNIVLNAGGILSFASDAAGDYELSYTLCQQANPANCDTAMVKVGIDDGDGISAVDENAAFEALKNELGVSDADLSQNGFDFVDNRVGNMPDVVAVWGCPEGSTGACTSEDAGGKPVIAMVKDDNSVCTQVTFGPVRTVQENSVRGNSLAGVNLFNTPQGSADINYQTTEDVDYTYPVGLLEYQVSCRTDEGIDGGEVALNLLFSGWDFDQYPLSETVVRKYSPETQQYYDFDDENISNISLEAIRDQYGSVNVLSINFNIQDDAGLADGLKQNSQNGLPSDRQAGKDLLIFDPIGPAVLTPTGFSLDKRVSEDEVTIGDVVRYILVARAPQDATATRTVSLRDVLPQGLQLVDDSVRTTVVDANGNRAQSLVMTDSDADARVLAINALAVPAKGQLEIAYLARVNAGAIAGEKVNRAQLVSGGTPVSNVAEARVRLVEDPILDKLTVIGKVFNDIDGNGRQDEALGELGLAGVRVISLQGQIITTDAKGRFHVPGVSAGFNDRGRNYFLKVDKASLPKGYEFTTENPRVLRITQGLMTRINFGVRIPTREVAQFEEQCREQLKTVPTDTQITPVYFKSGRDEVTARTINDIASALAQYQGEKNLRLSIAGHADTDQLYGHVKQRYGDNEGLSQARAETIALTISQRLGIDLSRIELSAYGDTAPAASNEYELTKRLNRRVDIQVIYDRVDRSVKCEQIELRPELESTPPDNNLYFDIEVPIESSGLPIYESQYQCHQGFILMEQLG